MKILPILLTCLLTYTFIFSQSDNPNPMEDWQYPYDVHYLRLDDSTNIAYVDEGHGEQTLLFIHGLGSYLKAWRKNIDTLSKHYRCIALDLPGYGKSSRGQYKFDQPFFTQVIRSMIEKLELKNVVLVGHSMGAQIAMHVVLANSANLQMLVLIAPAGFETFTEAESQWITTVYTPELLKATPEVQIIKNFEINFLDMPADARFMIDDRMAMRETPLYDGYCQMIPKCVKGMLDGPVFQRLGEIHIPTLILYGANDYLIPNSYLHKTMTTESVARSGAERIPHSKLIMIPSAGHFVNWEQAEAVNKSMMTFFSASH